MIIPAEIPGSRVVISLTVENLGRRVNGNFNEIGLPVRALLFTFVGVNSEKGEGCEHITSYSSFKTN